MKETYQNLSLFGKIKIMDKSIADGLGFQATWDEILNHSMVMQLLLYSERDFKPLGASLGKGHLFSCPKFTSATSGLPQQPSWCNLDLSWCDSWHKSKLIFESASGSGRGFGCNTDNCHWTHTHLGLILPPPIFSSYTPPSLHSPQHGGITSYGRYPWSIQYMDPATCQFKDPLVMTIKAFRPSEP